MTQYLVYFNQQWVGDHTEEWFRSRGPLAMAVIDEMRQQASTSSPAGWRRTAPCSAPTPPAAR